MKTLPKGTDRIKKICDELRRETLEPAEKEGTAIIARAEERARKIVADAEAEAQMHHARLLEKLEEEKKLFATALSQAARQSLTTLRNAIEGELFDRSLGRFLDEATAPPEVAAKLITALVHAIDREGTHADVTALIPSDLNPEEVNALLGDSIAKRLKDGGVVLGDFKGGVSLRLEDQQIRIDLSEEALKELMGRYLRKEFREILFGVEE